MNFKISKEELLNTLSIVSKGLPVKTPMPILYTIKVEAYEKYLVFTATNSDIAIEVIVNKDIDVKYTGSFCINGKYLIDIIKKLDQGQIEFLQVDENNVFIKTLRSEFKLRIWDTSEYVEINYVSQENPIEFRNEEFREILDQTLYAVATEEKNSIFKGVQFLAYEQNLFISATDTFRLSRKTIALDEENDFDIIIPGQSLKELAKILELKDDVIKLYISEKKNKALFVIDNISFQTRLIEGIYPDIERLITNKFLVEIPFNKNELLIAADRVSVLTSKEKVEYPYITLKLKENEIVEMYSRNEEIGAAQEILAIYGQIIGEAKKHFEISFSSKYLIEALKTYKSQEVILKFTGNTTSFSIYGQQDKDLLALILPVKLHK